MTADVIDATTQGTQKIKPIAFLMGEARRLTLNMAQIVGSKASNVNEGCATISGSSVSISGVTATTTSVYGLVTADNVGDALVELCATLQNGEVYKRKWLVQITDPEAVGLSDYQT